MKLKKAWVYTVDEQVHVTILDGSQHPFDITFIKWAGNKLPRKRTFVLK